MMNARRLPNQLDHWHGQQSCCGHSRLHQTLACLFQRGDAHSQLHGGRLQCDVKVALQGGEEGVDAKEG